MFLKKLYLLLIVYAALISISGCYAKEVGWMGWANTSPAEIKEGQNNNTDHVIEIKFDEIGDLGLWESKLIRKDSGIEDSAVGAVVEILGWLGALYLVLSIIF